jgi:hypothetical protein
MSLYRRPNSPHWWTRFQLEVSEIRLSTGTGNRREAEEFETVARTRAWSLTWQQVDFAKKRAWVASSEMKAVKVTPCAGTTCATPGRLGRCKAA